MSWKDILKAQLAILDREDARQIMRQYRGEQAAAIGKNIALIQQNLPDIVKEFKIMLDNPVREYDGLPHYQTGDYTVNVILVINYNQQGRNYRSNEFGGMNEAYFGVDERLAELFKTRTRVSEGYYRGVKGREKTGKLKEKQKYTEDKSYQITFPFKVKFDASNPILFGAEKLIEFLDELENELDRKVYEYGG